MTSGKMTKEETKAPVRKHRGTAQATPRVADQETRTPLVALQNHLGNAAVQRLLAQRSGNGPTELDDTTAARINSARGGGQALDGAVQTRMSEAMGADFSGVRVHASNESHTLNEQLGAKAFTTGQDIFFGDGAYDPGSSSGQELIAHELTHVVQQGAGAVQSGGKMAVNAPGDRFEQEADSVAKNVGSITNASPIQQPLSEEEVQTNLAQRQALPEEAEMQVPEIEEDEGALQRQEMEEEELPVA